MNKKLLKRLEIEILNCKKQMRELEPYIDSNASMAEVYNRTLIKKAILVDKYKKVLYPTPIVKKIVSLLKFKKDKKLICDYFQNG
ncbi:MAG: hypothetical protein OSJ27_01075 [Candidatus Gastranaerophilales bacterium]|nr:hypothetical protein [Candidatus Gastranaerophilales bacterium]